MDIDEFLDKEFQQGNVEEEKLSDKEDSSSAITEEEKDIIKHFFDLWQKVSESKFKWDNDLYTDLNKTGEQVKERLDKLSSKIKRDKKAIRLLIVKATNELKNKNYEAATKLYSELSDMRSSFPKAFLEEKKELNKEMFQLYEKLHDQIDSKFINDFKDSIAHVHNLVRNSFDSFGNGDVEKAKNLYGKAIDIYNNLPNGFLSQKMEISSQLLRLYKDLSIQTQIKKLQKHLSNKPGTGFDDNNVEDNELEELEGVIKERNLKRSKISEKYSKISSELGPLPQGHTIKDKTLLQRLVARKIDRAKVNLKRGLYRETKKNIDAVLKVDPGNVEANEILNELPVEY